MSDEVKEVVAPGEKLESETTEIPEVPVPQLSPLRTGYTIGVREDGSLVFEVLGSHPQLLEMVGLTEIASERIAIQADVRLNGKFTLLTKQLAMVDAKLNILLRNKADEEPKTNEVSDPSLK